MSEFITWLASVLCAFGVVSIVAEIYKNKSHHHFFIQHPLFLPLYSAGILQWFLWGIRSKDLALMIPTGVQLLCLSYLLTHWWSARLKR